MSNYSDLSLFEMLEEMKKLKEGVMKNKHTATPWKQEGVLIRGGHSDSVVCMTQLPKKGTTMTHYNNAEFIVKAVNNHERLTSFAEQVYELAFGDNAINNGYTEQEVLEKLREFSDLALKQAEREG